MPNHRRRRWREAMTVRVDLNGLLAGAVGVDGLAPDALEALAPELDRVRRTLADRRAAGEFAVADLPYRRADVLRIVRTAAEARDRFDTLVVIGIGGYALGEDALTLALGHGGGLVGRTLVHIV